MRGLLREIDQKCDDRVSNFHNNLAILFSIQVVTLLVILGAITAPLMFFQDNLWMKLLGGTVLLFSPISITNAIYTLKSATWHFWNTFENRMCE